MSAFGDYLENAGLDHFLNVSALAQTGMFLHLYITAVGDDDSGTEVVGNAYVPTAAVFGAAALGTALNSASIVFPEATGLWGLVAFFALKDGTNNLYYHGAFDIAKTIDSGDVAAVNIGDLSVSHD